MNKHQIKKALSDLDFFLDDSDRDLLFELSETVNDSSYESENQESVQLETDVDEMSSNWHPVTGNF